MVPGLGNDAGRLDQDAERSERIDLDREVRLDAEALRTVAVPLLDAALGIAAIAAHVPFAGSAGRTRHRIGPAHDADHAVADGKTAACGRPFDRAEGLVAKNK